MTQEVTSDALITADHVRQWVAERDTLAQEYGALLNRMRSVQQRLDALAQILPENVVAALIGAAPSLPDVVVHHPAGNGQSGGVTVNQAKTRKPVPITDAVENLLRDIPGGRTPSWIRAELAKDPEFEERVHRTPTSISNALMRLVNRGKALREDGLYYHPDMFAKIKSGELVEERIENGTSGSFNSVMHSVMQDRGGRFTASEAIESAKQNEFLRLKIEEQPSRVYSWLSREVFKHKLTKDGEYYAYPASQ